MIALPATYDFIDQRFRHFVTGNAALEQIASGLRWAEGPVWFGDQQVLLVSDIPNDRILRVTEKGAQDVFREPAGFPNGQTRDRQGRLVTCSHLHRAVLRTNLDGSVETLVDRFEGKRLNAPNDVVVKSDGSIWFTDPTYGIETDYEGIKQTPELPPSVYCLLPDERRLICVADDFEGANGLCFSPDESLLYVSETGHQFDAEPTRHIRVFEVARHSPALSGGRTFHTISPGYADGFKCDVDGNLWSSAGDGVHCISAEGELLGKILTPAPVSNLCFGGWQNSRLFLCCGDSVYAITINQRGCPTV